MNTQTFACGHCGQSLLCDEQHSGRLVQCPHCAGNVQLPDFAVAPQRKRAKPMAIASLALSLSSVLIGPFGYGPGIVCGHQALGLAKKSGSNEGKTLARLGLVVGYIGLALMLIGLLTASGGALSHQASSKSPKPEAASASTAAPPAAKHGNKVVVEFGGFEASGFGERAIVLNISNGFPKRVTELHMVYAYLDAQGKTLKEFPVTKASDDLAAAGTTNRVLSMAFFMPPAAARVDVRLKKAVFADDSAWTP